MFTNQNLLSLQFFTTKGTSHKEELHENVKEDWNISYFVPWVFFKFLKLRKWYRITWNISHNCYPESLLWWVEIFWLCIELSLYPKSLKALSINTTKWLNTLKQFVGTLPTNCLSFLDHFLKLALKGLMKSYFYKPQSDSESSFLKLFSSRSWQNLSVKIIWLDVEEEIVSPLVIELIETLNIGYIF